MNASTRSPSGNRHPGSSSSESLQNLGLVCVDILRSQPPHTHLADVDHPRPLARAASSMAPSESTGTRSCPRRLPQLQIEPSMEPTSRADTNRRFGSLFETWARLRTSLLWIVAIALLLRVGWILIGHTYKFKSCGQQLRLWLGDGTHRRVPCLRTWIQRPFGPPTGPTAWEPPLYPYLICGRVPALRHLFARRRRLCCWRSTAFSRR